ncbi:unnamed protein product, partial [Rotaria socialis]
MQIQRDFPENASSIGGYFLLALLTGIDK